MCYLRMMVRPKPNIIFGLVKLRYIYALVHVLVNLVCFNDGIWWFIIMLLGLIFFIIKWCQICNILVGLILGMYKWMLVCVWNWLCAGFMCIHGHQISTCWFWHEMHIKIGYFYIVAFKYRYLRKVINTLQNFLNFYNFEYKNDIDIGLKYWYFIRVSIQ